MQDLLSRIEELSLSLPLITLLIVGAICVVIGLMLWLGGLRYSGMVVGLLGAVLGSSLGLLLSQWLQLSPVVCAVVLAAVCTLAAVWLKNIVIITLGILIFALVGGTGYFGYSLPENISWPSVESFGRVLKPPQDLEEMGGYLDEVPLGEEDGVDDEEEQAEGGFWPGLKSLLGQAWESTSSNRGWVILWAIAGALAGLLLVLLVRRLVMALCCSIVGVTCFLCGLDLLLMAKGTAMVSALEQRPRVLPFLFMVMIVFGWLTQLVLAERDKKKTAAAVESKKD